MSAMWLSVCLFVVGPIGLTRADDEPAPVDAVDAVHEVERLRGVVMDPQLPLADRQAAALAILGRADVTPADQFESLQPLLEATDPLVRNELSAAVARLASEHVTDHLVALAQDAEGAITARQHAIQLLGHQRTRRAAAGLVELLADHEPAPIRHAGFTALANLTGRDDLGHDRAAWQAWWRDVEQLSDQQWQQHLFDNMARQGQRARQQQQVLESRLIDAHRTIYRATAEQDRPAQLEKLLEDPLAVVRQLAMDLAVQRLVDDRPFDESLRAALRARLDDPSPVVRQRAALLLRDLADAPAADRVAERLAAGVEQIDTVLRAELLMMSRLPRIEAAERSLELLSNPVLRGEAAGALVAAVDADRLTYQQSRRALRQIRDDLDDHAPPLPTIVLLLGKLGGEEDWQRIERWLDVEDDAVKQAAARAWAESDRQLLPLVQRLHDERIEPVALLAAARRGQTAATFRELTRFEPSSEQATERWHRALEAMAGRVASDLVLTAVRDLEQRGVSVTLCRRMVAAALEQVDASARSGGNDERANLLLARGRLRLAAGDTEAALADFDRIGRLEVELTAAQREQRHRGVIRASLRGGQMERAFETAQAMLDETRAALEGEDGEGEQAESAVFSENDSPLDLLLEAADQSDTAGDVERLERLVAGIRDLMGPSMTPTLARRLDSFESQLSERDDTNPEDAPEDSSGEDEGGTRTDSDDELDGSA